MADLPVIQHLAGYVAGAWSDAGATGAFAVHNPATGERLAELPDMGADGAAAAIEAAAGCGASLSLDQRRSLLGAIAEAHLQHRDAIGRIITLEQGKPLGEAGAEVEYAAGFYRFFAEHLDELKPKRGRTDERGAWTVHHRPIGVAALITPWNFPIAMMAKKLAAALAAGCPAICKPAGQTPLALVALFHLLDELNLPRGMVNLVLAEDAAPVGKLFCEHPAVRIISFTGSTGVGRKLMEQAAPQVKRLGLELGGNAPFIVFDDADLDHAAEQLIVNKFRAAGQTCVCANRVFVHRGVERRFLDALTPRVAKLKVGNGLDDGVDLGPLIDRKGFDKVRSLLIDALDRGAELVYGEVPPEPQGEYGCFFPPVVIRNVTPQMKVCSEEVFGPVVPVATFQSEEEVVAAGNDTIHGLAAYVFSDSDEKLQRVAAHLKFGHVALNCGSGPRPHAPFGGMKQSGLGREGGVEGLLEFCETQAVVKSA